MHDNEQLKGLLDMVHIKSEEILKKDPKNKYYNAVEWAKRKGLISQLTPDEIQDRIDKKVWRKVNKVIAKNAAKNKNNANINTNINTSTDTD